MNNFNDFDMTFGKTIRNLGPEFLEYCKDYTEKNLADFFIFRNEKIEKNEKLEIIIIVDAQAIISDALSYAKNKKSLILSLTNTPFLKIYAPTWICEELNDEKIHKISEKKKFNEEKRENFKEGILLLKEKINIIDPKIDSKSEDYRKYEHIIKEIEKRDKKDLPYVKLYLSIKTHGILTKDKHMTKNFPEIKIWNNPGDVGKVVSAFEKGALSFLIIKKGLPAAFKFLYEIFIIILKSIWEAIENVLKIISALIAGGIKAILPYWKILTILGVVVVLWDKSREIIINNLRVLIQILIDILEEFYYVFKNILNVMTSLIDLGIHTLLFLFIKIEETITTYKKINLKQF